MPYTVRKSKCTQSSGKHGSYTVSYTDKSGKKHKSCHTSKKKAHGQISAIEMGKHESANCSCGSLNISEIVESVISRILDEEVGRNYHTIDPRPNTWETFQDFEIDYYPQADGTCLLDVTYKQDPIVSSAKFGSVSDARHYARMVVDQVRVQSMNSK